MEVLVAEFIIHSMVRGEENSQDDELERTIADLDKVNRPGIFMDVFRRMLSEEQLLIEFYSTDTFPDSLME